MIQVLLFARLIIIYAIGIYRYLLLAYFLLSWLPGAYQSTIGQLLMRVCEPFVGVFRQFIPPVGMISFAGMAAFFSLHFFERGINGIFRLLIGML